MFNNKKITESIYLLMIISSMTVKVLEDLLEIIPHSTIYKWALEVAIQQETILPSPIWMQMDPYEQFLLKECG